MRRWVLFNCDFTPSHPIRIHFFRICHLQTGDFGWAFYHLEYSLVSFIEQQTKTILIGAYSGMIFSIYMLIKYMLSLELNSKPEFKGLTMGKVKGFENLKMIAHWYNSERLFTIVSFLLPPHTVGKFNLERSLRNNIYVEIRLVTWKHHLFKMTFPNCLQINSLLSKLILCFEVTFPS